VGLDTEAQAVRSRIPFDFSINAILPAALWPWGSTQPLTESARNLAGGKGRLAGTRLTTSLPSVSRLSRTCGSFDALEP
jgi:hypothetical protein